MTPLARVGARPWRLGARTRKGVLVVHIVSAGAWIGIDVVMGVLVFTALLAEDGNTKALCYRALELFAVWPLLTAGLVSLASGVVLGRGGRLDLSADRLPERPAHRVCASGVQAMGSNSQAPGDAP